MFRNRVHGAEIKRNCKVLTKRKKTLIGFKKTKKKKTRDEEHKK